MRIKHFLLALVFVLFFVSTADVFAKDDDFEFATSLAEQGYTWLAQKEFEKLGNSDDPAERVKRFYGLAKLFEQQKELKKRDKYLDLFIKEGSGIADPGVQQLINEVKGKRWDNKEETLINLANTIQMQLQSDSPDEALLRKKRRDAKDLGEEIVRYRREQLKLYKNKAANAKNDKEKQRLEIETDKRQFFLARTMFYYSFAFSGESEQKRRTILKTAYDDYLKPLMFMFGDRVILIPFIAGQVKWELEEYDMAASNFMKCIDGFPSNQQTKPVRKESYRKAVEAFYRVRKYRECAETANFYLLDYPGQEDRVSLAGHTVRFFLLKAIDEMDPDVYNKEIKEMLGFEGKRHDEACRIAEELVSENGARTADAREFIAEGCRGGLKYLAKGEKEFLEDNYTAAISSFQKGLKEINQQDISMKKRFSQLAKTWYYLGFSYYNQGMTLPAVICFKEGTTRFFKDYRESAERLTEEEVKWFLHNSENWKNVSGKFYQDTRSALAMEIFKEALLAYSKTGEAETREGQALNIHVQIGIIAMRNGEYRSAIREFEKVQKGSPHYLKAVRLKAQCLWAIYDKQGRKDNALRDKAFRILDDVGNAYKKKIEQAIDDADIKWYQDRLSELKARELVMLYSDKQYKKIIEEIDSFWENPPDDKERGAKVLQYQIFSIINLDVSGKKTKDRLVWKKKNLEKGMKLLEKMKKEYPEKTGKILKSSKALGFSFFNLSVRFKSKKGGEECLKHAGELLYSFIMNADKDVNDDVIIRVADILYEKVKDYKLSQEVTSQILERFKKRIKGKFPPYEEATKKTLSDIEEEFFDTSEAKKIWKRMTDRMYDEKKRSYFKKIKTEFWEEKPYMYEPAYSLLSEALMVELGIPPSEREELIKQRDSEKAGVFWDELFKKYGDQLGKGPAKLKEIYNFIDNSIFVNNYKYRLADCFKYNDKLQEAVKIFEELDTYYLKDPETKWKLADTSVQIAKGKADNEVKKKYIDEAKDIYLWIEQNTPNNPKDHWKAILKGAETYAVRGDYEGAARKLEQADKYTPVDYPSDAFRKKVMARIKFYKDKAKGVGAE